MRKAARRQSHRSLASDAAVPRTVEGRHPDRPTAIRYRGEKGIPAIIPRARACHFRHYLVIAVSKDTSLHFHSFSPRVCRSPGKGGQKMSCVLEQLGHSRTIGQGPETQFFGSWVTFWLDSCLSECFGGKGNVSGEWSMVEGLLMLDSYISISHIPDRLS